MTDLPARPKNGWCVCTHPVDHHSNSSGQCLMSCDCERPDVLMTLSEVVASLNMEAAYYPVLDSMAMTYSSFGLGEHREVMKRPELIEASRIIARAVIDFAIGDDAP